MPLIIPAIDIMQGQTVQAVGGERAHYQPIHSVLTTDPHPVNVVNTLIDFAPFSILYLADLDALMGKPPQRALILELCAQHPNITFWVDAGSAVIESTVAPDNYRPVIGTESISHPPALKGTVLSLDFDHNGLIGDPAVWADPQQWPHELIIMCLHRVGSLAGPDWKLLRQTRARQPDRHWIAAGGTRTRLDLEQLLEAEFSVLVASALHQGRLTRAEVCALLDPVY